MAKLTTIHSGKTPRRRHFLAEWLEERQLEPMGLVALLNDPDRSMDLGEIDKSQVYRWLKGQMPQAAHMQRIGAALELKEPEDLFRHPVEGWFSQFIEGRTKAEAEVIQRQIELMREQLELAFPRKTGTQ